MRHSFKAKKIESSTCLEGGSERGGEGERRREGRRGRKGGGEGGREIVDVCCTCNHIGCC